MSSFPNHKLSHFNRRMTALGIKPNQKGLELLAGWAELDASKLISQYMSGAFDEATQQALFAQFKGSLPIITERDIPTIFTATAVDIIEPEPKTPELDDEPEIVEPAPAKPAQAKRIKPVSKPAAESTPSPAAAPAAEPTTTVKSGAVVAAPELHVSEDDIAGLTLDEVDPETLAAHRRAEAERLVARGKALREAEVNLNHISRLRPELPLRGAARPAPTRVDDTDDLKKRSR